MGSKIGVSSTYFLDSDGSNIFSIFSKNKKDFVTKLNFTKFKNNKDEISSNWTFEKTPIAESIQSYLKHGNYNIHRSLNLT